jgi:hypothetical protein
MLRGNQLILTEARTARARAGMVAAFALPRIVVIKNVFATPVWLAREQRERK